MNTKVNFETASLCLFDILSFSDGFGLGVRMYCVVVIDFCHSFLGYMTSQKGETDFFVGGRRLSGKGGVGAILEAV